MINPRKSRLAPFVLAGAEIARLLHPQAASAEDLEKGVSSYLKGHAIQEMGELKYLSDKIDNYSKSMKASAENRSYERSATGAQYYKLKANLVDLREGARSPLVDYLTYIQEAKLDYARGLEVDSGRYRGDYRQLFGSLERGIIQYSQQEGGLGYGYQALRELSNVFAEEKRLIASLLSLRIAGLSHFGEADLEPLERNLKKILDIKLGDIPYTNLSPTEPNILEEVLRGIFPNELALIGADTVRSGNKVKVVYPDNELSRRFSRLEFDLPYRPEEDDTIGDFLNSGGGLDIPDIRDSSGDLLGNLKF